MRAFLSLLIKVLTFCKPDREVVEKETEARAAKQIWVLRDKQTHGEEYFKAYMRRKYRTEDHRLPFRGNK